MATRSYKVRVPKRIAARVAVGSSNGAPPTTPMGSVNLPGVLPWSAFTWIDTLEHVPELIWPTSVRTYTQMRADSQVGGLFLGITLPIRRYRWMINPNGAKDEIVQKISEDFNLPIQGDDEKPSGRVRDRFNWDDFLRTALLGLAYGFYFFEPEGVIKDGQWRMKNLWPRPPGTIVQVDVDDSGNLQWIKQALGQNSPQIPANRIVPFVWDKEGGNWFGRSIFRPMYKHWLVKDRLMRVDAMKHERNGLGIPFFEAPPNATSRQLAHLQALAEATRAGDTSGGAVPAGTKAQLVGTTGTIPDTLASINYQDEAMARSLLMMFMQLGQTMHGSRALGDTFLDYFNEAQETVALWIEANTSQYVIEDWVTWNFSEDEPCPRITHELNPDPNLSAADLANLIDKGAIHVDEELEAYIRGKYLLPPGNESPQTPTQPQLPPSPVPGATEGASPASSETPAPTTAKAKRRRKRTRAAVVGNPSLLPLPNRTLRRQPYEQELQASVDYAQMDEDYNAAKTSLVADVSSQQASQIEELRQAIVAAKGDLNKLSKIQASPIHAETILSRMIQMATTGAFQAINEAKRQKVNINLPDMGALTNRLKNRATAVDSLLARSISETAGRKAIQLTGGSLTPTDVSKSVVTYLNGLSTSYLEDELGGALQQAMNAGRKEVFGAGPTGQIYASELLDNNTCIPCTDVDGTQYPDLSAAEADYPTGGYMDCLGGPRCRGTLIAVYPGEVETLQEG